MIREMYYFLEEPRELIFKDNIDRIFNYSQCILVAEVITDVQQVRMHLFIKFMRLSVASFLKYIEQLLSRGRFESTK